MTAWYLSRSLVGRDTALDVFRGLAVAGMILVNNSGPGRPVYAPLVHAPWHGWTLADLIYPGFVFVVGVSVVLSLSQAAGPRPGWGVHAKILRRTALMFAIGLMLVGFPYYDLKTWPLTGVLQSIAVCYLAASLLYLHTSWRTQFFIVIALWIGYWLLLALVPAPGFAAGDFSREGNLPGYVDRHVLGAHMLSWDGFVDPSGMLATVSGIASALLGVLTGQWITAGAPRAVRVRGLLAAGAVLTVLGLIWDSALPINKNLWTGSFVAFSAGVALLMLALLYILMQWRGIAPCFKPLEIFGVNALLLYAGAYLFQRVLFLIRIDDGSGTRVRLRNLVFERVIDPVAGGELGTLLYCLLFLSVCLLVLGVLYRYRLYFKL